MISRRPQKNRFRQVSLSLLIIFIFGIFVLYSFPSQAQLFPPFSSFGSLALPPYSPFPQIPTYSFFTPFANPFGYTGGLNTNLLPTSLWGSLPPLQPSPIASIAGVTTVFIPPTLTNFGVNIKAPGFNTIKLTSLVAPLTLFIYPNGYTPPAPAPVVPPTITPPVITVTAPVIVAPTTTVIPAVLSGAFFPFFAPIF